MRRLEEAKHSQLLTLTPQERLFVQRWIELFDRDAIYGVRCRPVWLGRVSAELADPDVRNKKLLREGKAYFLGQARACMNDLKAGECTHNPVQQAEVWGLAATMLGFHPQFLFQAHSNMIDGTDTFVERLAKLQAWWVANAGKHDMTVAFWLRRPGRIPRGFGERARFSELPIGIQEAIRDKINNTERHLTELRRLGTAHHGAPPVTTREEAREMRRALARVRRLSAAEHDGPQTIEDEARAVESWLENHRRWVTEDKYFYKVQLQAEDPNTAAFNALESYEDYCGWIRAVSQHAVYLEIDPLWAVVDTSAATGGCCLKLEPNRFRLRALGEKKGGPELLLQLMIKDQDVRRLARHYGSAVDYAKRGDSDQVLICLSQGLDISFHKCERSKEEKEWGQPRLFVEKASILLALDWCRTQFNYLVEYCFSRSPYITRRGILDPQPLEYALRRILDDRTWSKAVARAAWDELLYYRRDVFVRELKSFPKVLHERRNLARWDLARAIRARNTMLHRGQPLEDDYLVSVLLSTFQLVLRSHLAASRCGTSFAEFVRRAEDEFNKICTGQQAINTERFVCEGWLPREDVVRAC